MQCVYVKEARYVENYKVYVKFSDGVQGEIDLKDIIFKYDIAKPLRDPEKFADFFLDSWPTLAWNCGFDIAPESLYEKCLTEFSDDFMAEGRMQQAVQKRKSL